MENTEGESSKQDRQESIRPRLPAALAIDQDDYKDTKNDPTIDENLK